MDSFSEDSEEFRFFDAVEDITPEPEADSNVSSSENWEYELWRSIPQSVRERRKQFFRWMLNPDASDGENSVDARGDGDGSSSFFIGDIYRMMDDNGAVLRTSGIGDGFSSSISSLSSWNADDLDRAVSSNDNNGVSNCGNDFNMMHKERLGDDWDSGLDRFQSSQDFEHPSSPSVEQLEQTNNVFNCDTPGVMDRLMRRWLRRWRTLSCMMNVNVKDDSDDTGFNCFSDGPSKKVRKVKVQHCKKKLKELSGLFTGQDIQAHEGSILAMKFSLDGQYLASAGEDRIVRIWQVVEEERTGTIDIPDADPSCVYFSVNHLSELEPRVVEKDKVKSMGLKKTPDSACIVFPQKVFRILDEPLHVFRGHCGEILDISWSKNNCLLSSSVDKTVRLWKVGVDHCLKVFYHTDYVTCIQFNPVNDDCFISGSIDGKVRMWTISGSQVIDWIETRDIVTAVSFRPDAQGGIIGCITGTCHIFRLSDNHFEMESQMCLAGKKKSPCKRIIGFQFLPHDPRKILVTSADSQIRIIDGLNVLEKYKGNAGNQISASFTSRGNHIVSASEDSNIYIWKYNGVAESSFSQLKVVKSFEFFSADSSIAITWPGLESNTCNTSLPFLSSTGISLSQEFPLDSNPKGSATWPEEKLPVSSPRALTASMSKSEYRLFRSSCQSSSTSHLWGLVIVAAGWDGRIRSFHNYGLPVPL